MKRIYNAIVYVSTWLWGDIDESKTLFCADRKYSKEKKNDTTNTVPKKIESKYFNNKKGTLHKPRRTAASDELSIDGCASLGLYRFFWDLRNEIVPF